MENETGHSIYLAVHTVLFRNRKQLNVEDKKIVDLALQIVQMAQRFREAHQAAAVSFQTCKDFEIPYEQVRRVQV